MAAIVPIVQVVSTIFSAYGKHREGQERKHAADRMAQAKDFEATQMDQRALAEVAAGQRAALEEQRRSRILQSRVIALGAAGGGATDPTVVDIVSDLAGEGAYRAAVLTYEGAERARAARMGAEAARFEGDSYLAAGRSAARAGNVGAFGTIFQGAASMYGKYGLPLNSSRGGGGGAGGGFRDAGTPGMYPYG